MRPRMTEEEVLAIVARLETRANNIRRMSRGTQILSGGIDINEEIADLWQTFAEVLKACAEFIPQ